MSERNEKKIIEKEKKFLNTQSYNYGYRLADENEHFDARLAFFSPSPHTQTKLMSSMNCVCVSE